MEQFTGPHHQVPLSSYFQGRGATSPALLGNRSVFLAALCFFYWHCTSIRDFEQSNQQLLNLICQNCDGSIKIL